MFFFVIFFLFYVRDSFLFSFFPLLIVIFSLVVCFEIMSFDYEVLKISFIWIARKFAVYENLKFYLDC